MKPYVFILALLPLSLASESCVGRCGEALDETLPCQCNSHCVTYGDCCSDYQDVCVQASCVGRCSNDYDGSLPCQCNDLCVNYGNCCEDYDSLCVGGGSGNDLDLLMNQLWNLDVNRVDVFDYTVNYQGQVSSGNTGDSAGQPFFTYLNPDVFTSRTTFANFLTLLDNYNPNVGETESLTAAEWTEINTFLDNVIATSLMQKAYEFLLSEGKTTNADDFRDLLMELWFNLYPRSSSGPTDSSGFEHVMIGEINNGVSGFHSWIQFYQEEKSGRIDYKGYVSKSEPEIVGAQFTWNGQRKSKGSFFVASSPEFDMAVYSVCALMHPNAVCSFTMNGHAIKIQTWDISHKSGYQMGSAYPI